LNGGAGEATTHAIDWIDVLLGGGLGFVGLW
jgi:hypothetical protein